ncbi:hypothetical protein COU56_02920 [Candidatus Pacearchaeota archaeon CG10_big_fil_rev_8_21_14_0_10_31_9]|nr:MAG: hypothetical protein COU56_02920 [Candidatus Pacearchaeota archaeon CG10_big_fil_rev_8_21_14_0_10_31_9]
MRSGYIQFILIFIFLFLTMSFNVLAQNPTILESQTAPEIIPLYNTSCPVNDYIYGDGGRETFDVIYSFDKCYQDFLNKGWDESICGKFSEEEQTWSTILDFKTDACFLGFAIAKEDYRICDGIKDETNYQNVYIDLPTCYTYTTVVSRDLTSCKLLNGENKEDCFKFFGPSLNSNWVLWFLPKVILYALISLFIFVIGSIFVKSEYRKRLISISIITTILQFLLVLIFFLNGKFTTDALSFVIIAPFTSLFLSAFIVQGYNFLTKIANKNWIFLVFSILVGFIHGFLTIFITSFMVYSKYGIGLEIIGIFVYSLVMGGILAVGYLLLYLFLISKVVLNETNK